MEIRRYPNKLKMFRRTNGYSQKKVARLLDFADTSTLSRWEHGATLPNTMQVLRLARIYHTVPHELYDEFWNQLEAETNLLAQDAEPFSSNQTFLV